jgi:predicted  nucleic acid-binding Zn-ribbon protein
VSESVQKKSGGFLDKLKGLVAEEVPDRPTRQTPVPAAPAHAVQHVGQDHYDPAPGSALVGADPAALAKLEARLQAACPAPYAKFMEQYDSLKEDISDERTRFKVALKTTHTTGVEISGALETLLSAMDSAKHEFEHSWDENRKKRVAESDQSISSSDELIKSSEEQIKAIQEKIAALRTKRDSDVANAKEEIRRLDGIRGGFEAAHHQVTSRLSNLKERLAALGT